MNNAEYLYDDKFISIPTYSGDFAVVPVSFLDEINERKLSSSTLQSILFFRSLTRYATSYEWTSMAELVGANLEGKTCYVYFANWEDSEWMSTSDARSVIRTSDDGYDNHRFLFDEKQEAWQYGEVSEEDDDDDDDDDDDFRPDALLGCHFSTNSSVLVITP